MKLFLASQASHPESMRLLSDFIGGFEEKSIAYVPTASNGESQYGEWLTNSSTWKLVNTLGANVTPVVLEDYKNSSVVDALKNKDVIWFAGGSVSYLMYWMIRCQLGKFLPELLGSGSVYVGSSAGSMVAGPTLKTAEWYLGEPENGASLLPGLNLIDYEIYPHFTDEILPEIKKYWHGDKLCLLKDGEAIKVDGKNIEILGEERFLEGLEGKAK